MISQGLCTSVHNHESFTLEESYYINYKPMAESNKSDQETTLLESLNLEMRETAQKTNKALPAFHWASTECFIES